jgi:hypothetical protein
MWRAASLSSERVPPTHSEGIRITSESPITWEIAIAKLTSPKRISDLGSRLRGNDVVGWQRVKHYLDDNNTGQNKCALLLRLRLIHPTFNLSVL